MKKRTQSFKEISAVMVVFVFLTLMNACGPKETTSTSNGASTNANNNASSNTNASPSTTAPKEKIVINYWYSWGDKIGETKESLVKMFNESQDAIEVKAAYQGTYDDQHAKVQAAFVAGNAPEVWENEIASVGVFAQAGLTQDLTPFVERDQFDIKDFIPGLMGNSYVDGKLYALPYFRSTPLLYYNKTLFKEKGLNPEGPKTWDEFAEFTRQLTEPGKRVGMTLAPSVWYYEALVKESGGEVMTPDGKIGFNSEAGIEPVRFWKMLKEEGVMKVPTTDDAGNVARTDFENGRSAMYFSSTADLTKLLELAKGAGFELGATFMPKNKTYGVPTGGANIVMTAGLTPEKQEAAWTFIKWITSKDQTIYQSTHTGYLPSRISAVESPEMQAVYKEQPLFKVAVDQLEYAGPRPMMKQYPEIAKILQDEIGRALIDSKTTPEAAIQAAAQKAEKILSK
ncbi:MAG: ABC transporter substrate-binding protein [Candidatus Carbobacillus sp.]|nr:ABC transporter substrate-binding protein [Candidatus Carbobacillus sp.]